MIFVKKGVNLNGSVSKISVKYDLNHAEKVFLFHSITVYITI